MRRDGPAGASRCAPSPRRRRRWCGNTSGAYSGEHGDGLCRGEWIAWQFGAGAERGVPRHQARARSRSDCFNPGKIIDPPRMDDAALFRFAPPSAPHPYRTIAARAGARLVGLERAERPADRGDHRPAAAATTPAVSRRPSRCATTTATAANSMPAPCARAIGSTRDEQHLTRGRANTLRLALSGQLGTDALDRDRRCVRGDGSLCRLQGMQARVSRPASTWRG